MRTFLLYGLLILSLNSEATEPPRDEKQDALCLLANFFNLDGNVFLSSKEKTNLSQMKIYESYYSLEKELRMMPDIQEHSCFQYSGAMFIARMKWHHDNKGYESTKYLSSIMGAFIDIALIDEISIEEQALLEVMEKEYGFQGKLQPTVTIFMQRNSGLITDEQAQKKLVEIFDVNKYVTNIYGTDEELKMFEAARLNVRMNVKAIKASEVAYHGSWDVYVEAAAYPAAPSQDPQTWDDLASGGFNTLGFRPDGEVRGSYSVTINSNDPYDFTVTGISDVDGDGVQATYIATPSTAPVLSTPPDVY